MKNLAKSVNIFLVLFLLSSCKINLPLDRLKIKNDKINNSEKTLNNENKLEIKISCGEGDIKEYLKNGWEISKEYSEEKICSWKSVPANNSCNIEKDKGCKVIIPDIIGKEIFYLLEKKN